MAVNVIFIYVLGMVALFFISAATGASVSVGTIILLLFLCSDAGDDTLSDLAGYLTRSFKKIKLCSINTFIDKSKNELEINDNNVLHSDLNSFQNSFKKHLEAHTDTDTDKKILLRTDSPNKNTITPDQLYNALADESITRNTIKAATEIYCKPCDSSSWFDSDYNYDRVAIIYEVDLSKVRTGISTANPTAATPNEFNSKGDTDLQTTITPNQSDSGIGANPKIDDIDNDNVLN